MLSVGMWVEICKYDMYIVCIFNKVSMYFSMFIHRLSEIDQSNQFIPF